MSWSISKLYPTPVEAMQQVEADLGLPASVKDYVVIALGSLANSQLLSKLPVLVYGSGHVYSEGPGGGSYPITNAKLVVVPMPFGDTLTLPLAIT